MGSVGLDGFISRPNEFHAARVLRAESYIDENHFLPEEARQEDGGEQDLDDHRASHFITLENVGHGSGRVIGNLRSIRKYYSGATLPVEELYPEAFEESSAPINSIEASRFISRHENKAIAHLSSLALIRAMVAHTYAFDQKPIYAVVEVPLAKRLIGVGLPTELIAEPKALPEYGNTVNMALRFDLDNVFDVVDSDTEKSKLITPFLETAREDKGLGYYDSSLLVTIPDK